MGVRSLCQNSEESGYLILDIFKQHPVTSLWKIEESVQIEKELVIGV
jgi:hypothetical protein